MDLSQRINKEASDRGLDGGWLPKAVAAAVLLDAQNNVAVDPRDLGASFDRMVAAATAAQVAAVNQALGVTPTTGLAVIPIRTAAPLTVLTTGSGAAVDIGTIAIPAWLTRWHVELSFFMIAETAAGTLAAANFILRTADGGTGTAINAAVAGPTAAGGGKVIAPNGATILATPFTAATLYVNQTVDSVNAGTVNIYGWIQSIMA